MDPGTDLDQRIAGIAALDQPVRRDLYRLLSRGSGWTSREEAADGLGLGRSVTAFHLDKLVDAGVLEVSFERRTGRSGPGAGRPAKLYRPRSDDVSASVPERRYDLAGSLLATAVADATTTGAPVRECLAVAARSAGHRIGTESHDADVLGVLGQHGYEPRVGATGDIELANCPFHRLAEEHRSLVCGMNLDFLGGLLDGMDRSGELTPRLQPEEGSCCVRMGRPVREDSPPPLPK